MGNCLRRPQYPPPVRVFTKETVWTERMTYVQWVTIFPEGPIRVEHLIRRWDWRGSPPKWQVYSSIPLQVYTIDPRAKDFCANPPPAYERLVGRCGPSPTREVSFPIL